MNDDNFNTMAMSKYPETIVLFITTHGSIIKRKDDSIITMTVPQGMRIIRTLSSIPGECNITGEDTVEYQSRIINRNMISLTSNQFNRQVKAAENVLAGIKREDLAPETLDPVKKKAEMFSKKRQRLEQIKRNPFIENEDEAEDDDDTDYYERTRVYSGYIHGTDRSHKLSVFEPGQKLLDKKYYRENVEATSTDWVIKLMNMSGQPDILTFLKRQLKPRTEEQIGLNYPQAQTTIFLSEIINFLSDKGVKTVIIFDVSCSNIFIENTENEEISEPETRLLRRRILDEKLGGKKKRRKTRKNKSVKRKKYSRKK